MMITTRKMLEKYDKRIIDRLVRAGRLNREEVEAYMSGLNDLTEVAEPMEAKLEAVNAEEEEGEFEAEV